MTRHTTFSFTLVPSHEQEQVLRRHVGAARFAFNQCLRMVMDALSAKDQQAESQTDVKVPWSGFDLINAFNAWKRSALFATLLAYKAGWYGAEVTLADRFYPSTRRCSRCGRVGDELSLSERIFRCSGCGHEADRDTNAAACLAQYPRVTASGMEPHVAAKHAETLNVCGEESAGACPVWSVRETVLCEAERTSVQRPRRAVLAQTVNTL